jgi:hypothetical protein
MVTRLQLKLHAGMLCVLLVLLTPGCERPERHDARRLVEHYNQLVCEAYRRGDATLAAPVVGPNESRKLSGLIGARLELGLTLDAELLALEVTATEESPQDLRVHTKERWHYRDRRLGSGAQVGEASFDEYEMLYVFKPRERAWLVDEIRFTAPPRVGRKRTPWTARPEGEQGMAANTKMSEDKQP